MLTFVNPDMQTDEQSWRRVLVHCSTSQSAKRKEDDVFAIIFHPAPTLVPEVFAMAAASTR